MSSTRGIFSTASSRGFRYRLIQKAGHQMRIHHAVSNPFPIGVFEINCSIFAAFPRLVQHGTASLLDVAEERSVDPLQPAGLLR